VEEPSTASEAVISRQASDDAEAGDRGDRLTHC
jgi:hypothetical protein